MGRAARPRRAGRPRRSSSALTARARALRVRLRRALLPAPLAAARPSSRPRPSRSTPGSHTSSPSAEVSLERAGVAEQQVQAANQVSIANAITTVRFLDALEWREFFERVSLVEATLRRDPAQAYAVDGLREPRPLPARARADGRSAASSPRSKLAETGRRARSARRSSATPPTRCAGTWAGGSSAMAATSSSGPSATAPAAASASTAGRCATAGSTTAGCFVGAPGAAARARRAATRCRRGRREPGRSLVLVAARRRSRSPSSRSPSSTGLERGASSRRAILPKLDFRRSRRRRAPHARRRAGAALLGRRDPRRSSRTSRSPTSRTATQRRLRAARRPEGGTTSATRPEDGEIIEAAVRGVSELNERYEAEHGMRPFHLLDPRPHVQRVRGRVDGLGAQARRARRARARDARRTARRRSRPSSATATSAAPARS